MIAGIGKQRLGMSMNRDVEIDPPLSPGILRRFIPRKSVGEISEALNHPRTVRDDDLVQVDLVVKGREPTDRLGRRLQAQSGTEMDLADADPGRAQG